MSPSYSPQRRTALVLVGTGTAGAYHAGVLRALRESGVRVDVVAGRGMGAASALFAAVDADPRLWDGDGVWTAAASGARLYEWRRAWQVVAAGVAVTVGALLLPLALTLVLAVAYPAVFLLHLAWPAGGQVVVDAYGAALGWILSPRLLLDLVPRVVAAGVLVAAVVVVAAVGRTMLAQPHRRRQRGRAWWYALGAPLESARAASWMTGNFWRYLRGAANVPQPSDADLSQRYAELLRESVGQPGYRELLLLAHDLDTRADIVFALLAEPARTEFFAGRPTGEPRAREAVDLDAAGRVHVVDALAGAVSLAPLSDPHPIRFDRDGPWRGEVHQLTDRVGGTVRLLDEVARTGARQVIVVSPDAPAPHPHALVTRRLDPRARLGDAIAAAEAAAVRDAIEAHAWRFDGVFLVRPAHNAIGPFDFEGAYDERSDRRVLLAEVAGRGYEDTYRQFIDPVVGASGDVLAAGRDGWERDLPLATDGEPPR